MKKILSVVTLMLFIAALSMPVSAQDPPKDSLKTEKGCPKSGDKKCIKTCDHKDCTKTCDKAKKPGCCKEDKTK